MYSILYIHQYFKTPSEPGGTRSYWFARELVKKGYSVTLLTARTKQNKFIEKELIDDINIIYIRNAYSSEMGIFNRILSFTRFMFYSTFISLRQKDIDLIFATSTPLTVGVPALLCKWIKGIPFIFEVRDLWPEVPIQMGALNNLFARKMALNLERLIYRNSSHIIALSPGIKDGILKTVQREDKVTMIPNMSKIREFYKRGKNIEITLKFNIDINKFNVIYFGAMNKANGLDYIIKAAEFAKEKNINDICFVLVGDGSNKKRLMELVREKELSNVVFIDRQPMKVVSELVNICDVSFVPFQNIPILETNSPNKFFDSLSAGIPIIVNSAGWTKDLVEKYSCGSYVDPENPVEFCELLIKWKSDPRLTESIGLSARSVAENVFDSSILCKTFVDLIDNFLIKWMHHR